MPARTQAAKPSPRQDVKRQAINLIFLMQWLQDGVDVGLKNNTDFGEFLFFFLALNTDTHSPGLGTSKSYMGF